ELRADLREIRADRHELRRDYRERRQDRHDLRGDIRDFRRDRRKAAKESSAGCCAWARLRFRTSIRRVFNPNSNAAASDLIC
ncbi:MAG: hypothetical protein ACRD8U_04120, partial [Pyrinomonadaceae bacterium]